MEPVQGTTGVVTPDNPAPSGDAGSENTLENLNANVIAQLTSPTDVNAGVVIPPTTADASGEPPAAAEPQVDETKPAEAVDEATAHRLRQDNADLKATLLKLGVEPESDTADQIRTGVITVDDLIRARTPITPTAPQSTEPTTPQIPLDQKISNLRNTLNQQGDVTAKTYKENMGAALEVIMDVVQANQDITQTMESNDLQNLLTSTMNVTKETFRTEVKSVIPEEVKEIAENFFIGGTEIAAGHLAQKIGKARAYTPQGYSDAAKLVAPKFDQLVQGIFKAGQTAAVKAIREANPAINTAVVNPITPGVGGGSPSPPANPDKFKVENLQANVDEYLRDTQPRV